MSSPFLKGPTAHCRSTASPRRGAGSSESGASAHHGDGDFAAITPGVPDGMRADTEGRLSCAAGVLVLLLDGRLVGHFSISQTAADSCRFSDADRSNAQGTSGWRVSRRKLGSPYAPRESAIDTGV